MDESGSVSSALMHLFYYQQGLFTEEEADSGPALLREVAGAPRSPQLESTQPPSSAPQSPPQTDSLQAGEQSSSTHFDTTLSSPRAPLLPTLASALAPPPSLDELARDANNVGHSQSSSAASRAENIRTLRARRAELQWRLETGALRSENEVLECQVVRKHEETLALQDEFKEMKDRFGEQQESLKSSLKTQRAVTSTAERRVVCTEDLVRFHEEQRRLMAGHWKSQCHLKDERIRYLNLQLTEYTIDWQHLGMQRQTEASLSHELQCLQDRHGELKVEKLRRMAEHERLEIQLAEARIRLNELTEAEEQAQENAASSSSQAARQLAATIAGRRGQLQLLAEWRQRREEQTPTASADPHWPHSCIWRDELDVRESQLEKITAQLDRTNNALHAAQVALGLQRARHEEMKSKHREAEAGLRESERKRALTQRSCLELQRAEAELRRALEQQAHSSGAAFDSHTSTASGTQSIFSSQPSW